MSLALKHQTATIANGTSLSNGVLIGDMALCGLLMSAAWTAASLSFQISFDDGVTWNDLYSDAGVEQVLVVTAPAGKYLALDPSQFAGITMIKIRSGVTGVPVNQGADRVLTLVSRKFYALH